MAIGHAEAEIVRIVVVGRQRIDAHEGGGGRRRSTAPEQGPAQVEGVEVELLEPLSSGQLEAEIAREDWYVLPSSADVLFRRDTSDLWRELVERARSRRTIYFTR